MALLTVLGGLSATLGSTFVTHAYGLVQGPDAIDSGNAKLLTVFVGLTAIAFVVIAIVVVVLAVVIFRLQKRLMQIVEEVKVKAMPIVDKTNGIVGDLRPKINDIAEKTSGIIGDLRPKINDIVDDVTPKIKGVTENVHQVSTIIREKVEEFETTVSEANQTARDANAKTHAQIDRVDGMISHALNVTAQVGTSIHEGIKVPIREATRGVSAVKQKFDEAVKRVNEIRAGFLGWKNSPKSSRPAAAKPTTRTTSVYPGPGSTPGPVATRSTNDAEFAAVEAAAARQADLETL